MLIVHRHPVVTVGDSWYEDSTPQPRVDLLASYQSKEPLSRIWSREFYTIVVDLKPEEDMIFSGMGKTNRYKISRAAKRDDFRYESWHADANVVIDEFIDFFSAFARNVALPTPKESWLLSYAEAGALDISRVSDAKGESLVWHTHYRANDCARLFHSASSFRNFDDSAQRSLIGRANRYHHWQDMLRFKASGITTYDFGGWYEGKENEERLRINQFKEEFGGRVVKSFNSVQPVTFRGRAYLMARLMRHPKKRLMHMV
ncbi:MAG TPA: hypothetical protein VHR84_08665 [Terriglobales bacterium]|jgi:hypothetical protein|nr:hypothetical protein [Terriglobales bacterium]